MRISSELIYSLCRFLPDSVFLRLRYKRYFKRPLNLSDPVTYNEKIQWLKLYDHNPEYLELADKCAVKQVVADLIGQEYVVPLLGVWDHYDDIDFDRLPDQFVLKCNHDQGSVVVVKDKATLDHGLVKAKLEKALKRNFYYIAREWPYKTIPHKIFAEEYLEDLQGDKGLVDYKLFFFSGECKAILVVHNRFSSSGYELTYYDPEWNRLPFTKGKDETFYPSIEKPKQLSEMLEVGTILAKKYPHVRMDFYIVNDRLYFGEYTFYPSAGFLKFNPDSWDVTFGDWIKLPPKSNG